MPISDKQQAFVNNYCTNGHNASKAYKDAYPDCKSGYNAHGARLITKDSIKQAIEWFMSECKEIASWSIEQSQRLLLATYKQATILNQPSAAVSAITAVNRLYGMDKDAGHGKEEKTLNLSKEALKALREQAAIVNKQSISKPNTVNINSLEQA